MITKIPSESRSDMSLLGLACCLAWLSFPVLFIHFEEIVIDIILTKVLMSTHFLSKSFDMLRIKFLTAITSFLEFVFPVFRNIRWIFYVSHLWLRINIFINFVIKFRLFSIRTSVDNIRGWSICV